MSSLVFILMVLHISAYSIRCLSSLFSTIPRRFVIKTRVGDDILDCCGLLIAFANLEAPSWIMYVKDSLIVSMSFRSRMSFTILVEIQSFSSYFFFSPLHPV